MTAKGYVRRTRSAEDARAYALEITEAGLDLLMRVLPRDAQVEAQVLARCRRNCGRCSCDVCG